ncbi:MAG: carbohydrate ABC transporter permease [Chloroflexota bacterium]
MHNREVEWSQEREVRLSGDAVAGPVVASRPHVQARRSRIFEVALGYGMLAPAVLLLLVFEIFPILYGLYISVCDWRLSCVELIGAENYLRAFRDPNMWQALLVTATYSLIAVVVQLSLSLALAYLLYQKIAGQELFRVILFLPYITSTVASAAVWSYLYSPDNGLLNAVLRGLGLQPLRWLSEPAGIFAMLAQPLGITLPGWANGPSFALLAVIAYTTWVFVGYDITIFLAGLSNIPTELYEAARVDGAKGWALFRHITFPLLSPTTFFLSLFTVIGTFKAFNHVYVLTQGGPGNATTTASVLIFQQMYQANRYGYSAALSFIVFSLILGLTLFQHRLASRRVVYE